MVIQGSTTVIALENDNGRVAGIGACKNTVNYLEKSPIKEFYLATISTLILIASATEMRGILRVIRIGTRWYISIFVKDEGWMRADNVTYHEPGLPEIRNACKRFELIKHTIALGREHVALS